MSSVSQGSDGQIAMHLSDRALTPLISSSRRQADPTSQSQEQALSSLTTTAIAAYDSASRLGLGLPQRIIIETCSAGPVLLHSYLNPQRTPRPQSRHARTQENGRQAVEQARDDLRPLSGTSDEITSRPRIDDEVTANGIDYGKSFEAGDGDGSAEETTMQQPPLLISSVIARSSADAGAARRAAARLERMGREFQAEWMREQDELLEVAATGEDG